MANVNTDKTVIFYDGECFLCNGFIRFVLKWDRKKQVYISPMQSDYAKQVLADQDIDATKMESVVLYEDGRVYTQSDVTFRVLKILGFPWSLLYVFILVPKSVRDMIYRWVARNRYNWFGKADGVCPIPNKHQRMQIIR